LDNTSYDWQEEIESKYQEIDVLYRAYQTDKVLLTEKMRQAREDEIIEKEKDVKNLQQKRFGAEGDLYKKQEELIRPIQNQIYNAIQEFAENGKYGIIFDKSSELLMLYSSKNLDKSDKILDLLGY
jgi:outer membrane protein